MQVDALSRACRTQISSGPCVLNCPQTGNGIASRMPIALYEPDIPQNTGTILRLAACLGVTVHMIEPAGFPTSDRAFRRAGMDYVAAVDLMRHASWGAFED